MHDTNALVREPSQTERADLARRNAAGEFGRNQSPTVALVVGVVALLVVVPGMLGGWLQMGRMAGGFEPPMFRAFRYLWLVGLLTIVATALARFWRVARGTGEWTKLALFARANRMTFRHQTPNVGYPGLMFSSGSQRRLVDHLFTADGLLADAGTFFWVTGSGDDETTDSIHYAAYRLPRPVPHIVVDALSNNVGPFSGFGSGLRRNQLVSLGGPVEAQHRVYAPEGYGQDLYQLFSPDVLDALAERPLDFDVEMVDDWLFCFGGRVLTTSDPQTWARLDEFERRVVAPIARNAGRYADRSHEGPVASAAVGAPAPVWQPSELAPGGQRLRRRFLGPVGVAVLVVFLVVASGVGWIWWQVFSAMR